MMRNKKRSSGRLAPVVVIVLALSIVSFGLWNELQSQPDNEAERNAVMARVDAQRKASEDSQIGLIQFCVKRGGVPIVLYAGSPDVRMADCKFPFPVQ